MLLIFWGLAITMIGIAIAAVTIPLAGLSASSSMACISRRPDRRGKSSIHTLRFCVAFILPVFSLGTYAYLGSPGIVGASTLHSRDEPQVQSRSIPGTWGKSLPSVGTLVGGLRDRLQREADDADGWLLLARSYHFLGRYDEAVTAYRRAAALGRTDTSLERLLKPDDNTTSAAFGFAMPSLRGRIALTPEAAARVNQDDTVFIFAKKSRNDRMPVVALRRQVSDLPIDFVLTDEQAMVPGTRLADFESLVVTARISRSGLAKDVVDGLEAWSDATNPNDGGEIRLLIGTDLEQGNRDNE